MTTHLASSQAPVDPSHLLTPEGLAGLRAACKEGRGLKGWKVGAPITDLADVRPGDVLIEFGRERGTTNVLVCLSPAHSPHEFGEIAYFNWLDFPQIRGGFALWDHEIKLGLQFKSRYFFHAVRDGRNAAREANIDGFKERQAQSKSYWYDTANPSDYPARVGAHPGTSLAPVVIHRNPDLE